jgi:hypothetical protein
MVDLIEHCRMACDELIDLTRPLSMQSYNFLPARPEVRRNRANGAPETWFSMVGSRSK